MRQHNQCWLCGKNGSADPLDKHHIFGGANRSKSEKYGLYVYLCHHDCHIFGVNAAHRNPETRAKLREYGQRKAMKDNCWSREEFAAVFGKNYLDNRPQEAKRISGGFCIIDGPELPF